MARFTEGEMEVMKILWEHGELKPAGIQELHPRPIKNPALRSYLKILVEKGHVTRRRVGKAFYYRARTRRETAYRSMLRQIVQSFCGGSTEAFLCNLIREEDLSERELIELKKMADAAAEGHGGTPKGSE